MSTLEHPRPHAPWCERPTAVHATCHWLVKAIEVTSGLRILVDLNRSPGVPTLISLAVDRGGRRTLVPLTVTSADELGTALTLAAVMAREV